MFARTRAPRPVLLVSLALAVLAVAVPGAHTYLGLEHGAWARARVQSPNANAADLPVPIAETDLSIVCFKVRNTSPFDSRITAIGLDIPGDRTGYALVSPTDGDFHLVEQVAHVPELPGVTLDVALVTGRTFGGGRPNAGLPPSDTLTTFCVSGPFDRTVAIEKILDHGVLRFQRVGPAGEAGDIAVWENRPQ